MRRPLIRNACSCATPQEFDAETYGLPTDPEERAKTPIMMYCTGGIRCEYFSAKLREQGFEKVYKLQGGIQHYGNVMGDADMPSSTSSSAAAAARIAESLSLSGSTSKVQEGMVQDGDAHDSDAHDGDAQEGVPHWRGSMFVFDRRNTVRFGAEATANPSSIKPIGRCKHCGAPTESFYNWCVSQAFLPQCVLYMCSPHRALCVFASRVLQLQR